MCTVIVVNHHYKGFPLVIAANRDEDYHRASSPVQILSREPHLIIGGKDDVKGGTWLGVNKHSLFVTGTNQGPKNPDLRSRGLLIMDALKCKTLEELIVFVEELNPAQYSGFNLIFGNSKAIFLAHSYLLHSMVIRELPPGVHVISSDMQFTGEDPKAKYIHHNLDESKNEEWLEYYKILKDTLASSKNGVKILPHSKSKSKDKDRDKDRDDRKRSSSKKKEKVEELYGHCTRSSSILAFNDDGLARYKFQDRTAPRPKKKDLKEGEALPPRYKDYIDLFRNPDAVVMATSSEEKGDDGSETEKLSPKETILKLMKKHQRPFSVNPSRCICITPEWDDRSITNRNCPVHGHFEDDYGGNDD